MSNQIIVAVEKKSNDVVVKANALDITNQEQFESAVGFKQVIQALKKEINVAFDEGIEAAKESLKKSKAQKARYYDPVDAAHTIVKVKLSEYAAEKKRKEDGEQARLQRIADRKEEVLREKARKAEEEGNAKKAEKYAKKAEDITVPDVKPTIGKVAGSQQRTYYHAVVTDKKALMEDCPEGFAPKMDFFNGLARASKGENSPYKGLKFVSETKVV